MCDERTASKMSSFSTVKRNGLSGANIIRMAQLQQYWTNGIGGTTAKYTHNAHLILLKFGEATSITLPAPSLHDLLNPDPASDDSIIETDPYGATLLKDDEFEDDNDNVTLPLTPGPVITRSSALERLEIDSIINLAEPKLIARFNERSSASIKSKAPATHISQKTSESQKWSAANTNWAASDDFEF